MTVGLTDAFRYRSMNDNRRAHFVINVRSFLEQMCAELVSLFPHMQKEISMDTSYDIRTLNSLIATTIDSVDGYETAATDASAEQFASMFRNAASDRRIVMQDLRAEVIRLGGEPEDDGTVLASAHRVFLNLRDAITGKDDKAIIAEVERGEDHIKAKFEDAIADHDVNADTRAVIESGYIAVKRGHDQMRDLKHGVAAM
jgi:uncharacterized protein (TIGR02284 family)